jgi:hypothetical protein
MSKCIDCNMACNPYTNTNDIITILYSKLPLELCEKIMTYYLLSYKCSVCQSILCYKHASNAKYYHQYYRNYEGYMCDNCCWWELS